MSDQRGLGFEDEEYRRLARLCRAAAGLLAALGAFVVPASTNAAEDIPLGVLVERVPVAAHPEESYALYLPSSYSPSRPTPILYGFDPRARGRVPVERFQAAAERYGWAVVGSNASRNGIAVTDILRRLWQDTHTRFAIDERRVYTAGFSGGARVASGMALASPGVVAGVIAFGAGLPSGARLSRDVPLVLFGAAGVDDFNLPEVRQLAADLDAASLPNRLEIWDGGHEWAPAELCALSVEWLELAAMRSGTRARDDRLVEQWARRDEERARRHETAGAAVEAALAFDSLAEDFRGLRETGPYAEAAARVRGSRAFKDALRAQRDEDRRQARLASDLGAAMRQLTGDGEGRLAALTTLRISVADLKRASEKESAGRDAHVARRTLGGAWVQALETSSALRARKDYRRAAEVLAIAGEIRPLGAGPLFELAQLHSLGGEDRQALQALERAVERGFRDVEALLKEPAFDGLRGSPRFGALVEKARAAPRAE